MALAHGGNVYEIASQLGRSPDSILDYSASINPLGPPPGLADQFHAFFHRLRHYPDIGNRSLLEGLSRFHDLSPDRIVVGNGSTELIYWLPKVLGVRKATAVLPTFSEYRKAFELQGVKIHKLVTSFDTQFQPTVEQLEAVCRDVSPEAILFTHPGSPAGTSLPSDVRGWIIEKSGRGGIVCIVDEVFVDFCEQESLKTTLAGSPGLVLIRSMTKFYGVPGLRLGYLLTSEALTTRMRSLLPPWSVNTLAQIAGVYCLQQEAYHAETLRLIETEREWMRRKLEDIGGFLVLQGRANYLLVQLPGGCPPVDRLQRDLLLSEGILVRDCSSFEGLSDRYMRLAVRLPEENRRLLEALARWVEAHVSSD